METILEEAARLTSQERHLDYGHPKDDFKRQADMLNALGFRRIDTSGLVLPLQSYDIPDAMIAVKLSRRYQTPFKRDHLVDIAGYARTAEMLEDTDTDSIGDADDELHAYRVFAQDMGACNDCPYPDGCVRCEKEYLESIAKV